MLFLEQDNVIRASELRVEARRAVSLDAGLGHYWLKCAVQLYLSIQTHIDFLECGRTPVKHREGVPIFLYSVVFPPTISIQVYSFDMSAEKRPASNVFGSSQMVVKRQKSDANLGTGSAISVVNGSSANGALIQGVSLLSF